MKNESKIDANQMQRLIDGELSADEIRSLLEVADQNPEQWRSIACAFTEDQLFAKQFETLTAHIDPEPAKPSKPDKTVVTETKSKSYSMPFVKQLAVVASLAVAGLVGYMVGSDGPITASPDVSTSTNMIAENDTRAPALTPVDLEPEYRMELLTPDGESIDGEVDLYRYSDLDQLVHRGSDSRKVSLNDLMPPSGFSAEARKRLNQSGYDINETTNYVSGRLQDGRQFVVPVRSIRFDRGH